MLELLWDHPKAKTYRRKTTVRVAATTFGGQTGRCLLLEGFANLAKGFLMISFFISLASRLVIHSFCFQVKNESHGRKSDESHFHVLVVSQATGGDLLLAACCSNPPRPSRLWSLWKDIVWWRTSSPERHLECRTGSLFLHSVAKCYGGCPLLPGWFLEVPFLAHHRQDARHVGARSLRGEAATVYRARRWTSRNRSWVALRKKKTYGSSLLADRPQRHDGGVVFLMPRFWRTCCCFGFTVLRGFVQSRTLGHGLHQNWTWKGQRPWNGRCGSKKNVEQDHYWSLQTKLKVIVTTLNWKWNRRQNFYCLKHHRIHNK